VRDAPTTIKAFRNACRHRATAVATGRGSAECFVCPFHGWTYGLDGSLQAVPAKWDFPHVDQETTGLHPVLAEVFDGWVFINMDPSAPPLAEFLGDTITRHLLTHPSEGKHKTLHVGLVVESNWKATAEAFMEAYHVPQTHPQGRAFIGDLQTRYDIFGRHARTITPKGVPSAFYGPLDEQVIFAAFGGALAAEDLPEVPEGTTARQHVCDLTRAAGASQGLDAERISDAELLDTIAYNIFPNFLVVLRPGASSAMRFRPNGDDHTTSIFEYMVFNVMPPDQDLPGDVPLHMLGPDESLVDYQEQIPAAYFYDQDVGTLVLAKKGLRNADQLLFGHRQERNIVAFHRHLAQFIADREQ
jgi:phenylpropionate dioxygenase-like ring-hydroxylating dioxygenase large terminal subunit